METEIVLGTFAVLSACILLIVLAIQLQIKSLHGKVDAVLSKMTDG